jgi:NADPH:quinone reductase-like Zn-dependent oxidoreductase
MARVVRIRNTGGPEVLQVEELILGTPKLGDVRIKVAAIGLNRVEAMFRQGQMGIPALPSKIGYEAAGVVNAVGATPIAITRGKNKADALRKHGARHVVVTEEQNPVDAVREITIGHRSDL